MSAYSCAVVVVDAAAVEIARHVADLLQRSALAPVPSATGGAADALVCVGGIDAAEAALDTIAQARAAHPAAPIVVVGEGWTAAQVQAVMQAGAYDFVAACNLAAELVPRLGRAVGQAAPGAAGIASGAAHGAGPRGLVYASEAFAGVAARILALSACDANVLVLGETGTGKEVCAQALHYGSSRASRPWVAVNCGAIPTELVESELFGHVRGAFSMAHASRQGLVREAEGGTLFLDDIDTLPLPAQVKLLRFLQEREYRQVGANALQHADVRIIAASNRSLKELSQGGGFRADLYFRLNVLNVRLPPLRERREDIAVLSLHFMQHFARAFDRQVGALTPGSLRKLLAHDWPGNVRELRHVIERAVVLARGPGLVADDIEIDGGGDAIPDDDQSFRVAKARMIDSFERRYLENLLGAHHGNVTHAARAADKNRRAFFELLRKHHIDAAQFRA